MYRKVANLLLGAARGELVLGRDLKDAGGGLALGSLVGGICHNVRGGTSALVGLGLALGAGIEHLETNISNYYWVRA